ncbi:hypothetical protein IWX48DRAFT_614000 [Phyllosticta citricarpa]
MYLPTPTYSPIQTGNHSDRHVSRSHDILVERTLPFAMCPCPSMQQHARNPQSNLPIYFSLSVHAVRRVDLLWETEIGTHLQRIKSELRVLQEGDAVVVHLRVEVTWEPSIFQGLDGGALIEREAVASPIGTRGHLGDQVVGPFWTGERWPPVLSTAWILVERTLQRSVCRGMRASGEDVRSEGRGAVRIGGSEGLQNSGDGSGGAARGVPKGEQQTPDLGALERSQSCVSWES